MNLKELVASLKDCRVTIGEAYVPFPDGPVPVCIAAIMRGTRPRRFSVKVYHYLEGKVEDVGAKLHFTAEDVTEKQAGESIDALILNSIRSNQWPVQEKLEEVILKLEARSLAEYVSDQLKPKRIALILEKLLPVLRKGTKSLQEAVQAVVRAGKGQHIRPAEVEAVLATKLETLFKLGA